MQVLDICEVYDDEEGMNCIQLFGRDAGGVVRTVVVRDTPHTVKVAISPTFKDYDGLANSLNAHLCKQWFRCRALGCACGGDTYGVYREPCGKLRPPVTQAVRGYPERLMVRGFEIHEVNERPFLCFTLAHYHHLKPAGLWLEQAQVGYVLPEHRGVYDIVNSATDSFMLMSGICGFRWVEYPIHLHAVSFSDIKRASNQDIPHAPFETMVFDIETISPKYNDEESKRALYPVGMISAHCRGEMHSFVLTTPGVVDAPRSRTTYFDNERDLLMTFHRYIKANEVDFVSGYNSNGFDVPYLVTRAKLLGVPEFAELARGREGTYLVCRERMSSSKGKGMQNKMIIDCPGRIFLDLLPLARDSFSLRSHTLSSVADHLGLGCKGDVKYPKIHEHFTRSAETRLKLLEYCERDVELTVKILAAMGCVGRLQAKSGVFGVRPQDALDRGVSYLVTMLVRMYIRGKYLMAVIRDEKRPPKPKKAKKVLLTPEWIETRVRCGLVAKDDSDEDGGEVELEKIRKLRPAYKLVPGYEQVWNQVQHGDKFEGGAVFEPVVGLHQFAIFTLDFNSLYANLVRTYNICHTTLLKEWEEGCYTSPAGFHFAPASKRLGVFPEIMSMLIQRRTDIRERANQEAKTPNPDQALLDRLDAEQLEVKVAANSLYGQMGAVVSDICLLAGAASITAEGRNHIHKVETALRELAVHPDWVEYGIRTMYGDTDSLFIGLTTVFVFAIGYVVAKKVAQWINKESGLLTGTMRMGFENVSMPTLLVAKKKYAKAVEGKNGLELLVKGMDTRAITPYASKLVGDIWRMGMLESGTQEDIAHLLRDRCSVVLAGRLEDRSQLLKSAKLSKPIEAYDQPWPAHVVAARMLVERDLPVIVGDRIQYYVCKLSGAQPRTKAGKPKKALCAVPEDLAEGFPLDLVAYVEEIVGTVSACALHFFKGTTEEQKYETLRELAMENDRVSQTLRRAPDTGVRGGMDMFVQTMKKMPYVAVQKTTMVKRPRQMTMNDFPSFKKG